MSQPLSVQALGRTLVRHWILLLMCTLLLGTAAVAASFLIPRVYTASATQLVKGLPGRGAAANYEAAQFAVNRAKSYPSFVYSSTVLEAVRRDLDNGESVVDLREDLTATNPAETPLIVVSATGSTPEVARDKANSAARHLARFITQIETVAGISPIGVETPVEASSPTDTTSPKRLLMGAVGALVGFAVGTLAALARSERVARRRPTQDERDDSASWWSGGSESAEDLSGSPTGRRSGWSQGPEQTPVPAAPVIAAEHRRVGQAGARGADGSGRPG